MLSRTSRILLVVAALAVVVYALIGRSARHDRKESTGRLAAFDMARVDGVTVQRRDETLRFARADSAWRMSGPVEDIADPAMVMSLLDALAHAEVARDLGHTDDLAQFGLDPPEIRITLRAGPDTLLAADLGKRTVDDGWTYARSGTPDLLLVPTDISRAATQPADAYRNPRVLDFQTRNVARYELRAPDHSTAWMRRARGWCAVESGDTIAGDSVAVESVLRRLRGLRVGGFLAGADTLLTGPVTVLTLWEAGGARFAVVRFAAREGRWLAHVDRYRRTVVVGDDISDLVANTTNDLRDRRLLQFSPPDAARIVFTYPSASGELVRAGGNWSFPNPAMGRIDPNRAAEFVRALRALKWDGPAGSPVPGKSGFGVLIIGANGEMLDQVAIEPRENQATWYVSSRSAGAIRTIERAKLDHLAGLFRRLRGP